MNVLIRFISRLESGAVEHHDRAFVGESLTLGRATNQDIHLRDRRVALEHAEIRTAGGGFEIVTRGVSGITVNDSFCRRAPLAVGDTVYVGSNILRIIDPPDGFDFAFTFELDPEARAEDAARVTVRDELAKTSLNKRTTSWILLLAVVIVFLAVPLLTFGGGSLARMLRATPAPDDKLWLSGPLHPSHQLHIGDDCSVCHEEPFVQVRDSACLACHAYTTGHAEDAEVGRCQACHKEHNEPAALVLSENSLCADCHAEVQPIDSVSGLLAAEDFSDGHPQFRVTMLVPDAAAGTWTENRIGLDEPQLAEQSNLEFPHDKHLAVDGVTGPDGNVVLECDSCHVAEQGGRFLLPVRMDEHCHGCHSLEFDELAPGRQVPHAPIAQVRTALREYYAARLLTGRLQREPDAAPLRIPGEAKLTAAAREETLAAANRLAGERLEALLESVCTGCHVLETDGHAGQAVSPIRLTQRWMPKAHFSHASHQAGLECADCHAAGTSTTSADVLMPKIDSCRECHRRNLASTCTDCHDFHLPGAGLMSDGEGAL